MQRNPEDREELKMDTDDDCEATYTAARFFVEDGEEKEALLDRAADLSADDSLSLNHTELILDAFYELLCASGNDSGITQACARGALSAFDIQPPARVVPIAILRARQIF